jgi:hypothetical protein
MLGAGHFLLLLGVGVAIGWLFDHLARPSQIPGTNRAWVTSALVGVAGTFVGYHLALVIGIVGIGRPVVAVLGALGVLWGWRMVR